MDILFEKDTTIFFKLVVNHPVKITLAAPEIEAACFSIPKDTSEVSIDFSLTGKNKGQVRFAGKNASISNYLTNYKLDISSTPKSYETITRYTDRVEYLTRKGLEVLNTYNAKAGLPSWFVKMEESDIRYSGARDKVYQFKIRKLYHYSYQEIPKDFIKKLGVRFDDPSSKYSLSYYGYLNNVSTLKLYELAGRQEVSPNDMYRYIHDNIDFAKMKLSSDLKELYITQRICALLSNSIIKDALTSNDSLYFQRVDSLLQDARDTFRHSVLADILLDFRKKQLNNASKKI